MFQNRFNGSVSFYRDWNDYTNGFGNLSGEFWLGNEKVHYISNQRHYALKVSLFYSSGESDVLEYDRFSIEDEETEFMLEGLGIYNGSLGM